MAEAPITAARSTREVVDLGIELAVTLYTYVQTLKAANKHLSEAACLVNASATSLQMLNGFVESDKPIRNDPGAAVLTADGVENVEWFGAECGKVYEVIIQLINRASRKGGPENGPEDSPELRVWKASMAIPLGRTDWEWISPRIDACEEQLGWLTNGMIFHTQLASLGAPPNQVHPMRAPGTWETELVFRAFSELSRKKYIKRVRKLVPDEPDEDDDKDYNEDDAVSVAHTNASSEVIVESWHGSPPPPPPKISEEPGPDEPQVVIMDSPRPRVFEDYTPRVPEIRTEYPRDGDPVVPVEPQPAMWAPPGRRPPGMAPGMAPPPTVPWWNGPDLSRKSTEGSAKDSDTLVGDDAPPAAGKTEEPLKEAETAKEADNTKGANDGKECESTEAEAEPMTVQQRDASLFPSWIRNIFGNAPNFLKDAESQELEAFVLEGEKNLFKLPFGHNQLQYGLKRVSARKRQALWDQYLSLQPQRRQDVDHAITAAKQQSPRSKVCVAIEVQAPKAGVKDDGVVFFLSLGDVVEPIHLKDAVGRKMDIPFEHVRTWKMMKSVLTQAFKEIDVIYIAVRDGRYDLLEDGRIILPRVWESTIKPGTSVIMEIWPARNQWQPRPSGPPGYPGRFMPPPGWNRPGPPPMCHMPPPPVWHNAPVPPGWGMQPQGMLPPGVIRMGPPPYRPFQNTAVSSRGSTRATSRASSCTRSESPEDIAAEMKRLGLDTDFAAELIKAERSLTVHLEMYTNALDTVGDLSSEGSVYSDDDTASTTSSSEIIDI